jgi:hypothetical protein
MTDKEAFTKWFIGEYGFSPLLTKDKFFNMQAENQFVAWQAHAEHITKQEMSDKIICANTFDCKCPKHYTDNSAVIAALREALEFECGGRCDPYYNPCSARQALNELSQEKGEL